MGAVRIDLIHFLCIYLLLIVVLLIMKRCRIKKAKLLLVASIRMTLQLILVGYLLTYVFEHAHPVYTAVILLIMIGFSIHRAVSVQKMLNIKFKVVTGLSLGISGLAVLSYFVCVVVGENFFNPQYTIPLSGMIIGNAMTGVTLALKTFVESITREKRRIISLLNLGVPPMDILQPLINSALETALLPTINSMLGMGIIFLPGMMTGQMLSGTLPTTAILYQICIMIAICTSVSLSVFCTLRFGARTLCNNRQQILFPQQKD